MSDNPATLLDSVEVVLPSVPAVLVPPTAWPHLRRLARLLPAIPRGGFEVALSAAPQVDLQQCIVAGDGEPSRLHAHLSTRLFGGAPADVSLDPAWRRLSDFVGQWSDESSPLHEGIAEIWLECDQPSPAHPTRPSVFCGFPHVESATPPASDSAAVACAALDALLGQSRSKVVRRTLQHCFEACPSGAFVSHVGVMIGRPVSTLRVNVKRLDPRSLATYLARMKWPGAMAEADAMMARLFAFSDRITVCLDLDEHLHPQIGFECILREQPPKEPRWASLLTDLVEQHWCSPAKRDALLAWPGWTTPMTSTTGWPSHLIRSALLRPVDQFTMFDRRLSHIKVVCRPQQGPEAKAYFGFVHVWGQPFGSQPEREPTAAAIVNRSTPEELDPVAERTVQFLLDARMRSGWWHDFPEAMDGSDAWVTAFVGSALALASNSRARAAAHQAWQLLTERCQELGGWGYNSRLPVDADSTTWALRLARAVGAGMSPRALRGREALDRHVLPDGGIHSYREEVLPRPLSIFGGRFEGSYDGWCRTAHGCVTAAAAGLEDERPREFLRHSQCADGRWRAYWWEDDAYATVLAAEALAATGRTSDSLHVQRAAEWAVSQLGPNGAVTANSGGDSAFATACCVGILSRGANVPTHWRSLERAVEWLRAAQRADGSWPPSARMRIPLPDIVRPDSLVLPSAVFLDEAAIFTSAWVLAALEKAGQCR